MGGIWNKHCIPNSAGFPKKTPLTVDHLEARNLMSPHSVPNRPKMLHERTGDQDSKNREPTGQHRSRCIWYTSCQTKNIKAEESNIPSECRVELLSKLLGCQGWNNFSIIQLTGNKIDLVNMRRIVEHLPIIEVLSNVQTSGQPDTRWWQHYVWSWPSSIIRFTNQICDLILASATGPPENSGMHDVSMLVVKLLVKHQHICSDAKNIGDMMVENTSTRGLSGSTLCWCIIKKSFCTAECSLVFSHALIAELKVIVVAFLRQIYPGWGEICNSTEVCMFFCET